MTLTSQIDGSFTGGGVSLGLNKITGGESTAETARTRDPGEKYDRPVIGPASRANVIGTLNYDQGAHGSAWATLDNLVGTTTDFSIVRVIRDGNQNRSGTRTYTGYLVRCSGPEGDTQGGTDHGTLELEWSVRGPSV